MQKLSLLKKTASGLPVHWLWRFVPTSADNRAHVLGLSIKKGKKQRKRRQEELATNVRKTERGNLLKLSKEGENLVSQTRFVPVKKNKLKEETLM